MSKVRRLETPGNGAFGGFLPAGDTGHGFFPLGDDGGGVPAGADVVEAETFVLEGGQAQEGVGGPGVGAGHAIQGDVAALPLGAIEHGVEAALGAAIRVGQVDLGPGPVVADASHEEGQGLGIRVGGIEHGAEGAAQGPGAGGFARGLAAHEDEHRGGARQLQGAVPQALAEGVEVHHGVAPGILEGLVALGGVGPEGGQEGGHEVGVHEAAAEGVGEGGVGGLGGIQIVGQRFSLPFHRTAEGVALTFLQLPVGAPEMDGHLVPGLGGGGDVHGPLQLMGSWGLREPRMSTSIQAKVEAFLAAGPWAVVGASSDRDKYGNKVLRCYQQHGMEVFPINPRADEIEGLKAYPSLSALPKRVTGISVITPPKITEQVVKEAIAAGVKSIWMQPGAESQAAVREAEAAGLEVIANGACILVVIGYREWD